MAARPRPAPFPPNRAARALILLGALLAACLGMAIEALVARPDDRPARTAAALGLTDLALFTEARYTRNPALADLHSPFQDHPVALDHFPSGSLIAPPHPQGRAALANGEVQP
jgi:hypothetical protein